MISPRLARIIASAAALSALLALQPAAAGTATKSYETSSLLLTSSYSWDDLLCVEADAPVGRQCAADPNPLPDPTDDGQVNIGGVSFEAVAPEAGNGQTFSVTIRAQDSSQLWNTVAEEGGVRLVVCQNWDPEANITCGEAANSKGEAEPNVSGCVPGTSLTSGPSLRLDGARKNRPVVVFVYAFWGCPTYLVPDAAERPGGGTSGRLRMTW